MLRVKKILGKGVSIFCLDRKQYNNGTLKAYGPAFLKSKIILCNIYKQLKKTCISWTKYYISFSIELRVVLVTLCIQTDFLLEKHLPAKEESFPVCIQSVSFQLL